MLLKNISRLGAFQTLFRPCQSKVHLCTCQYFLPVVTSNVRSSTHRLPSCNWNGSFALTCVLPPAASRSFATTNEEASESSETRKAREKVATKKGQSPGILLIDERRSITKVKLEDAATIAKKKKMFLIQVDPVEENLGPENLVYKLVTKSDYYGEDVKHHKATPSSPFKDEKTLILKSTTTEHDVMIKVKQMIKWVAKSHTVKILIGQPGDGGNPEMVYKLIENAVKTEPVRIVQKIIKNGQVKFQLLPPKPVKAPKEKKTPEKQSEPEPEVPT